MDLFFILSLFILSSKTHGKEVCCHEIGCFDNSAGPMSHLPEPQCPENIGVMFELYTTANPTTPAPIDLDHIPPNVYDPLRTTIVVVHGWMSTTDSSWIDRAVAGLLKHYDANILVVDWKDGADKFYYPKSAANTQTVGAAVAHLIQDFVDLGEDYEDIWCIGFSLGAHTCGHAGMRTKSKIKRITGLDPAGPSFRGRTLDNGLNPEAASFVDVIHTDGAGLVAYCGLMERRGHIDFYPNGGRDQPGCYFQRRRRDVHDGNSSDIWLSNQSPRTNPFVGCHHSRAHDYFIETLEVEDCHVARQVCTDQNKLPASCHSNVYVRMGAKADESEIKEGIFYLETRKRESFCRF